MAKRNNQGHLPWGYRDPNRTTAPLPKEEVIYNGGLPEPTTFYQFGEYVDNLEISRNDRETLHSIVYWCYWMKKGKGLKQHITSSYGNAQSIKDKLAYKYPGTRFSRTDMVNSLKSLYRKGYVTDITKKPYEPGHDNTIKKPEDYEWIVVKLDLKRIIRDGYNGGLF